MSPHLPDEALHACGREDEQKPRRTRVDAEGVGDVLGAEEERAGPRLYRLVANVEGHLAFEDVEALVLEVVDVQQTLLHRELRNEYLYQGVATVGLLPRGLDGGQPAHPPPPLAFPRIQLDGPARGFFSGEHGPLL